MEIPVYLFTGFLESGKTTFTSNSLLSRARGKAYTTSAKPPVLTKGKDSKLTNKTFFIFYPCALHKWAYLYHPSIL